MKIAVTSTGREMNSGLDPRFGRASCFIVVDTKSGESRVVENSQNPDAAQGAGIQSAQAVANLEVDAVMTGYCGPKAFRLLEAAGIKVYLGAEGTVEAAVEKILTGEYSVSMRPDVARSVSRVGSHAIW